jgi:murein L,D-transpeptidase YcbB/YkuD
VNVPSYSLNLIAGGRVEFAARVITGLPSWPTPTLESAIERIEANPYWNVPTSITRRELAPKIAADPGYLARNDMRVLAGPPGAAREISPDAVEWGRFAGGVRLRQDPGPDNPLGAVKFHFANPYDVYLHDTPGQRQFQREARALSHGCVRVENALELAKLLVADDPRWPEERLRAEIATGRNFGIALPATTPVFLVYVTAWVDPDGAAQFRPDVYGREAGKRVAAAPVPPGPAGG